MAGRTIENYINGEFVKSSANEYIPLKNPATGRNVIAGDDVISKVPVSTNEDVILAVNAAKEASPIWASTPIAKRVDMLYKLKDAIEKRRPDLVSLLVDDGGKTLQDADAEVSRALQNIDAAANIEAYAGRCIKGSVDTHSVIRPVGVHASINPYNFPLMVPFWTLPYAIASGNTSVVKASEQAPLALDAIASIFSEIGLPPGVANIIHGDGKTTGNYLITHPDVDAVTFVGSTKAGKEVYKTAAGKLKRVQALCSAKNSSLVTAGGMAKDEEDLFLDSVVKGIISAAYGAAGQRCAATSNILVVEKFYERLMEKLIEAAKRIKVGYGGLEGVDMGPVISGQHLKRLHSFIEKGAKEGAKIVLDGRDVKVDEAYKKGYYLGPTILAEVTPEIGVYHTEAFGPILNVCRVNSLEEGVAFINKIRYGNIAVLYSLRIDEKDFFVDNAGAGMVGVNVPIPAAWAPFSFGGKPGSESIYGTPVQGQRVVDFLTYPQLVMENSSILEKAAERFHQK